MLVGSGAVGGGFSLIEDKTSGFLRALLVAPVPRTYLVLAKLAARVLVSLVLVAGLALLLALFTPIRLADPLAGAVAVAAITAIFVALGVAIAVPLRRLDSFRLIAAMVTVPPISAPESSIPSRRCPRPRAGSPMSIRSPMVWICCATPCSGYTSFRWRSPTECSARSQWPRSAWRWRRSTGWTRGRAVTTARCPTGR